MKRFTIMLMICALMMSLLFSACGTTDNTDDGDIGMTNADSQGDLIVEPVPITAKTYDEYQALLIEWKEQLPENFDHFDNFVYFGEFQEFRTWHLFAKNGYQYDIVDQAQIELILHVNYTDKWAEIVNSEELSDSDINPTDMRTLPSKQKGTYEINGLTYHYAMGELLAISWSKDGKYYTIAAGGDKKNYPIEASTMYAKLLNIQAEAYPLMCTLLLKYEKS